MKRSFLCFCFLSFIASSFAQKPEFTISNAVLDMGKKYAIPSLKNIQWHESKDILFFTKDGEYFYEFNPVKNSLDSVNWLASFNQSISSLNLSQLKNIPNFTTPDGKTFHVKVDKLMISYNIITGSKVKFTIPNDAEQIDIASNNSITFRKKDGLYIQEIGNNLPSLISQGNDSIVIGDIVHRNEFGINKGTFWSPDGNSLAFYRMDQSMVAKYPIINIDYTPSSIKNIYYPMAGNKSHHVKLLVYNIQAKNSFYVQTNGDDEHYLTNISWSYDSKELYIIELNRDQNEALYNAYDATNGQFLRTIYREKNTKYVEPLHPIFSIPNTNNLIFQSNQNGWSSLYICDREGKNVNQLTKELEILEIIKWNKAKNHIYFTAIPPNSIDKHSYMVDLKSNKTTQLTFQSGSQNSYISPTEKYNFVESKSKTIPNSYTIKQISNGKTHELFKYVDPLSNVNIGQIKIDTIEKGGVKLFARTIFPSNFDPQKKYPVIVYVYGGPHTQMISNSRLAGASAWMPVVANKGFIIFTIDNRGSENRGLNFEQTTFQNLGQIEMLDQIAGYEFISKKPFVDKSRIGVHGWSYGGFMAINLVSTYPEYFKVAVAGGPVIDWKMYEIMYTERYMDTPQSNPNGYESSNLLNKIPQLNCPLLIIHGTSDDVVVWQHSLKYIKKCIESGKKIDYFVYPQHLHNVYGKDRIHLINKILDYFIEKL